jgi:putative flavoprotein involved in K+ transport
MIYDVLVIGAGQASLAAGYYLQQAGYRFALLEGREQATGSWPRYYESLTLFSPARFSPLPGLPFPGDPEHYPRRDEVSDYLRGYAHSFQLPVIAQAQVERIEKHGARFSVHTTAGEPYDAWSIIAATGAFGCPHVPQFPKQDLFTRQTLHAAAYHHPEPFRARAACAGGGCRQLRSSDCGRVGSGRTHHS